MGSPFAARVKRTTRESLSELEQFVVRLRQLGATDDEIQTTRDSWDELDDEWTAHDRTSLTLASDEQLRAELGALRAEFQHDTTDETQQEAIDAASFAARTAEVAASMVKQGVGQILEWVGEDVGRAIAILALEVGPNGGKRKTLVPALEQLIAGPDDGGIPVTYVGDQPA